MFRKFIEFPFESQFESVTPNTQCYSVTQTFLWVLKAEAAYPLEKQEEVAAVPWLLSSMIRALTGDSVWSYYFTFPITISKGNFLGVPNLSTENSSAKALVKYGVPCDWMLPSEAEDTGVSNIDPHVCFFITSGIFAAPLH